MTVQEKKEKRASWIKSLSTGDKVCVTNTHRSVDRLVQGLFQSSPLTSSWMCSSGDKPKESYRYPIDEVCRLENIRGILPDGCIVVGNDIFNPDGELKERPDSSLVRLELVEPTEELEALSWKLKFANDLITIIPLMTQRFTQECLKDIIKIINSEVERINREATEAREKREEEQKVTKKEEGILYGQGGQIVTAQGNRSNWAESALIRPSISSCSETCANYEAKDGKKDEMG